MCWSPQYNVAYKLVCMKPATLLFNNRKMVLHGATAPSEQLSSGFELIIFASLRLIALLSLESWVWLRKSYI